MSKSMQIDKMKKGFNLMKPFTSVSDPDWIQTNDLLLRRQLLYSTELPDHFFRMAAKISFLCLCPKANH